MLWAYDAGLRGIGNPINGVLHQDTASVGDLGDDGVRMVAARRRFGGGGADGFASAGGIGGDARGADSVRRTLGDASVRGDEPDGPRRKAASSVLA